MSHSIITLTHDRFYTRVALTNPLLNIGGETYEVEIVVEDNYKRQQFTAYKANSTGTKEKLCEFCSWHMHGGPNMYQIEGVSAQGYGDATLIVRPSLEAWSQTALPDFEVDEDERE